MPGRGRPRKSAKQKIEEGKILRNERDLGQLDTYDAEGKVICPRGLTDRQKKIWKTLSSNLPEGLIGARDSAAMDEMMRWYGVYDALMAQLVDDPTNAQLMNATSKAFTHFVKIAETYGWTPRDRGQIKVPPNAAKKEEDPFDVGIMAA